MGAPLYAVTPRCQVDAAEATPALHRSAASFAVRPPRRGAIAGSPYHSGGITGSIASKCASNWPSVHEPLTYICFHPSITASALVTRLSLHACLGSRGCAHPHRRALSRTPCGTALPIRKRTRPTNRSAAQRQSRVPSREYEYGRGVRARDSRVVTSRTSPRGHDRARSPIPVRQAERQAQLRSC